MYLLREGTAASGKDVEPRVQLMGSRHHPARGASPRPRCCEKDWGVAADVWSCASLHRAARATAWTSSAGTCCNPTEEPRSAVRHAAAGRPPARSSPRPTTCACSPTRSARSCRRAATTTCSAPTASAARDTREKLREFFEVNRHYVDGRRAARRWREDGAMPMQKVAEAIAKYGIDPNKPNPVTV